MARKNEWQKGLNAKVKSWLSFDSKVGTWTEQIKKDLTSRDISYEKYGDYFFNRSEKYRVDDVVRDGLVCWLDGRDGSNTGRTSIWRDRSGHGNDAVLYGFDFNNMSGWGTGYLLNKSGDFCEIPVSDKNMLNGITLIVHCRCTAINNTTLGDILANTEMGGISIPLYGLEYKAQVHDSTKYVEYTMPATVGSDVYLTVTLDRTSFKYNWYVDGVHAGYSAIQAYGQSNANVFNIFGNPGPEPNMNQEPCATHKIYNIMIYNRALTPDEVLQNYNYEKSIQRG